MNVNELGFSGLSPKILLYKRVKRYYFINVLNGLKHFMTKNKTLIESKDTKIYFTNKFIICRLNMYLRLLYGPGHAKMCLKTYANNKGAVQPAHPRSLISTFVVRCFDSMMCILALSKVSRF